MNRMAYYFPAWGVSKQMVCYFSVWGASIRDGVLVNGMGCYFPA